jgi:hypothetical protein
MTMRTLRLEILAPLLATAVLTAATGSASATKLAANITHWRATFNPVVFRELGFNGATLRCDVTLEGSFHSRTSSKVSGQLSGSTTRVVVSEVCTGGSERVLAATLPWHIRYQSFTGTLPSITAINMVLVGDSFLIEGFGFVSCLYTTTEAHPTHARANREAGGVITSLQLSGSIPSSTGGCPDSEITGTGSVKDETGTVSLTVSLVA